MTNADKFLGEFNKIEKYLRNKLNLNEKNGFKSLVEQARRAKFIGESDKEYLKEFADLRNLIVHTRNEKFVIAEPTQKAINKFTKIVDALVNPPKIVPKFQKKVEICKSNDSISDILLLMRKRRFSQIPVYKNKHFEGLLNTNAISMWLAANIKDEIVSITETLVSDVMQFTESKNNFKFLSRNTSIVEALEHFHIFENNGQELEAILITNSGKENESLLGIITVFDISKAQKIISN